VGAVTVAIAFEATVVVVTFAVVVDTDVVGTLAREVGTDDVGTAAVASTFGESLPPPHPAISSRVCIWFG
jgi:hypothetical protein